MPGGVVGRLGSLTTLRLPDRLLMPRRRLWLVALAVAALVATGGALQTWLVADDRIPFSSDQAVVGLMAMHILAGNGHPVFYFGATYGGSFEAHLLAAVFALVGPSIEAYRATMAGLTWLVIAGVTALTWRWFGRRAGLTALAYLCVPPFFFLYKGLTSDGAYDSVQLAAIGTIAAALWWDEALERHGSEWLPALLLGGFAGFGLWITPVCLPVSGAALAWLLVRRAPRPSLVTYPTMAAGALVGGFPWWVWNLRHGWASLKAAEMASVTVPSALKNIAVLAKDALAVLTGIGEPHQGILLAVPFRFAWLAMMVAVIVLLLPAARATWRGERRPRLLFLSLGVLCVAAAFSSRFSAVEPRYLVAFYVVVPPLLGIGVAAWSRTGYGRLSLAACLSVVFTVNLGSLAVAKQHRAIPKDADVTSSLDPLREMLLRENLRWVYANYWTSYRLAFESGGAIVATPIAGEDTVRIGQYLQEVQAAPDPAVVLQAPRQRCFERYLEETGLPFRRERVDGSSVFWGLPPATKEIIRRSASLPMPRDAYRVGWKMRRAPGALAAGSSGTAVVEYQNEGPCTWMHPVHVGIEWSPLAPGGSPRSDSDRALPNRRVGPGETVVLEVAVRAPTVPGRYRLQFDLVHEGVAWFSHHGAPTLAVDLDVT